MLRAVRHGYCKASLRYPSNSAVPLRWLSATVANCAPSATKPKLTDTEAKALSSCPENTILTGVNYLKGQAPVLAKKDEEYPPWLWDLLKPKSIPDDEPGGKGEKIRLRASSRARIKEQNFMKTQ